ncbi:2-amino-4-hydroxy-6-hydroxymethyldihydropteridine diphosphokinase [Polaromonas sp. YR568]|uniref:2-amino-4-hydroxy-6- hydroxymethyldihydropteridine diphosphokinase n=1 Tax=Polaromonas sp. YR568 TaxID=1855301 RepID=UPI0031382AAC
MSAELARPPVRAYVGLGANLGDASAALTTAVNAMAAWSDTQVVARSRIYRTSPLDTDDGGEKPTAGDDYLNAVVALDTTLPALALLARLQQLELQAGRERPYRNAPRTLDLDLLLYGSGTVDSAALTVPHPRMQQRAFVLVPLAEIAPERVSPASLASVAHQAITPVGAFGG